MPRTLIKYVLLFALVVAGCSNHDSDTGNLSTAPVYEPKAAPIIFIPGLLSSEIGCGPDSETITGLWPAAGTKFSTWLLLIRLRFPSLGLVNTLDEFGGIDSRTTSSDQCGSVSFQGGETAQYEPAPLRPEWCLPEDADDPDPDTPKTCTLSFAEDIYASFGVAMNAQIELDGRGQLFIPFAWDWRKSPREAALTLDNIIREATAQTGVKATVVAHSFGNFVFREWLLGVKRSGGNPGEQVGRFLSVAGPWWGVATAWKHLSFGILQPTISGEALSYIIGTDTIKPVFQSSPGLYWLLPSIDYDNYVKTNASAPGEHWLATGDDPGPSSSWVPYSGVGEVVDQLFDQCPQSDIFPCLSRRLYDQAVENMPVTGFDRGGLHDFTGLVGSGLSTALQICDGCEEWPDGGDDGAEGSTHLERTTTGDENVPVFSAIQGDDPVHPPGDPIDLFFTCGVSHDDLMINEDILSRIVPYLTGDADLSFDTVFRDTPCALGD